MIAHHLVSDMENSDEPGGYPDSRSKAVSEYLAQIGRKGGKVGGKRRLITMTSEQRSEVARKAAKARWANTETQPQ